MSGKSNEMSPDPPDRDDLDAVRKAAEHGDAEAQYELGVFFFKAKNIEQAVFWWQKAAEHGDAEAQYNLGVLYYTGDGTEKDLVQAAFWWRKAAEQGKAEAQNNLGACYHTGTGVAQDLERAIFWYRKAAEQGDADAQCSLGTAFYDGSGVPRDFEQAVFWYRKAAEQGHADAQYNLGGCYLQGEGVGKNPAQAIGWYRKAAEQGSAEAQYELGVCYHKAEGVPQDFEQAVYWLRKSAEQGFPDAQCSLGTAFFAGSGGPQDFEQAVFWYRKAADRGLVRAQYELGGCYLQGEGVPQDFEQAVFWYRKAAEQGDADAQYELGVCYYDAEGVPQDFEQAAYWWRKAAEQGNAKAQYNLGVGYLAGEGVAEDPEQAAYWLRKAAEQGSVEAQYNLGVNCHEGNGVPKDLVQAVYWWRKAAEQGSAEAQCSLGVGYLVGEGVAEDPEQAAYWLRKAAEQGSVEAQRVLADCAEELPRPPGTFIVRAWRTLRRKILMKTKKTILIVLAAAGVFGVAVLLRCFYLALWTTEYIYPRGVELTAEISPSRMIAGLKFINHEQDLPPEFPDFYLKVKDHLFAVTPDTAFSDWENFAEKITDEYHVEKKRTATSRELRLRRKSPPNNADPGTGWTIIYRNNVMDRLEIPLDDKDPRIQIGLSEHSLIPAPLTLDRLKSLFGNGNASFDGKKYTRSFVAPIVVLAKGTKENNTVIQVGVCGLSPWRSQSLPRFPIELKSGNSVLKINRYTAIKEWVSFCEEANIGYIVSRDVYYSPYRIILTLTNDKKANLHFTACFCDGKLCSYALGPTKKIKIRIGPGGKNHVPPFSQKDVEKEFISQPHKIQAMRQ